MSSIRNAVSTIKNFFGVLTQNPEVERNLEVESRQVQSSAFPINSCKKRPAPNVFEPEITDDEDDNPRFYERVQKFQPLSKRVRLNFPDFEMASRKSPLYSPPPRHPNNKYITRGSGIAPTVEGLTTQPWEFNFNFDKRQKSHAIFNKVSNSNISDETRALMPLKTNDTEKYMGSGPGGPSSSQSNVSTKYGLSKVFQQRFKNPKSPQKKVKTSDEDIEVITLDADVADSNEHRSINRQLPPSQQELSFLKPRVSNLMKSPKKTFTSALANVGKRLLGCQRPQSTASMLLEKKRYEQLVKAYTTGGLFNNRSSLQQNKPPAALSRSRLDAKEMLVMYNRYSSSPTSGSAVIKIRRNSDECSTPSTSTLSKTPIRLYSSPDKTATFRRYSTTPKQSGPPVVDLEKDSKSSATERQIVPYFPNTSVSSTSEKISSMGNFSNLEDALNKTLPEDSLSYSDYDLNVSHLEKTTPEENNDISIIAEKIVKNTKYVNSLALEQTSCPYTDEKWLGNSKRSWREDQKRREASILEQQKTMQVLERESTLEKDLEERIRKKLTFTEIIVLEEPPEAFPELTDNILRIVQNAKGRGPDNEVLAKVNLLKDTISITRGDVKTLVNSQWLNDNVINTYMGLIVLRSKMNNNYPKVYAFQTFFYPKLLKEGYSNSLKRWTRKDDIFAHDLLIFPIHLGLHWCLACVDFRRKTINYYDSLGGINLKCPKALLDYITREMKERKQQDLNPSEWKLENVQGIPQQQNGSDCGMYACKFAEYLSRDAKFTFDQNQMPYFRDRMIYELVNQDLLHP